MLILKSLFYITGAIFFIVVTLAMFLIVYRVWYTTHTVKKILLSGQIEELMSQLKNGIVNPLRSLGVVQ